MLEKSENQAGCEFRYVSLLGRSRCGRRTTYRVCITSSSASSCVSPIAGYSCSLSARRQQSGIDPGQYLSCRLPFLYSPQLRKSPMSPGIPPGNSMTRAASRKPCGLRSRSHRTHMSDASPRNVAGQLGSPKNSFPPRSAAWCAWCISPP